MNSNQLSNKNKTKVKFGFLFLLVFLLQTPTASAQLDTLRIVTYNLLNFPSSAGYARLPYFRTVINEIKPDIVVVQELETTTGLLSFLNNVMNAGQSSDFAAGPFINGPDTDNGILYNKNKVKLLAANSIRTSLRDIVEYKLQAGGVPFNIYSLHLKAGQAQANMDQRLSEANTLRAHLNNLAPGSNFLVLGDFNMLGTFEPGFVRLTEDQADNDGKVLDPINAIGTWHNNQLFAKIHTQSTRTTSFNGGSTGGMDDRLDFILVSPALMQSQQMWILKDSYTAFGNDGRHFNKAINDGKNWSVADSVAEALHKASDHLPVYADFVVDIATAVPGQKYEVPESFSLNQNYPNPFNSSTWIRYTLPQRLRLTLTLFTPTGEQVAVLFNEVQSAGEHTFKLQANFLPSGLYILRAQAGPWVQQKKLILLK